MRTLVLGIDVSAGFGYAMWYLPPMGTAAARETHKTGFELRGDTLLPTMADVSRFKLIAVERFHYSGHKIAQSGLMTIRTEGRIEGEWAIQRIFKPQFTPPMVMISRRTVLSHFGILSLNRAKDNAAIKALMRERFPDAPKLKPDHYYSALAVAIAAWERRDR